MRRLSLLLTPLVLLMPLMGTLQPSKALAIAPGTLTRSPSPLSSPAPPPTLPSALPPRSGSANFIVVYKPGTDPGVRSAAVLKPFKDRAKKVFRAGLPSALLSLNASEFEAVRRDTTVAYIAPDLPVKASGTVVSPPWGLDRIDQRTLPLSVSFSYADGASPVDAYVIDTGVLTSHAEFSGRVKPGFSTITDGLGTSDCNGHGTHVAGTLAGSNYGVAKTASIIPVRVLNCVGSGYTSDVLAGLDFVVQHHVAGVPAVVNLSLGGSASQVLDDAIARVVADGVTVAVAAGNSNVDACLSSPARAAAALTVAAVSASDARASFSSFGSCVDIFAPGVSVLSAGISSNSASATMSGTSMATPHVAGAAAVLLSVFPSLSPSEVSSRLLTMASLDLVSNPGAFSPNRMLFLDPTLGTTTPPTTTPPTTTPPTTTPPTTTPPTTTPPTTTQPPATPPTTTPPTTTQPPATPPPTTAPPVVTPATPTNLKVSTTRNAMTLSWTPGDPGSAPLIAYRVMVYRSGSPLGAFIVKRSATSVKFTGFSRHSSYRFSIQAVSLAGQSPYSPLTASYKLAR